MVIENHEAIFSIDKVVQEIK